MKKVIEGATKSSYGIYAAQIAGAPSIVIKRAKEILNTLEKDASIQVENIEFNNKLYNNNEENTVEKKCIEEKIINKISPIEEEIKDLNINNITPLDALNLIHKWRNNL